MRLTSIGLATTIGLLSSCGGSTTTLNEKAAQKQENFSGERFAGQRVAVLYKTESLPNSPTVPVAPAYVERVVKDLQTHGAFTRERGVYGEAYRLSTDHALKNGADYVVVTDQTFDAFPNYAGLVFRTSINETDPSVIEYRKIWSLR